MDRSEILLVGMEKIKFTENDAARGHGLRKQRSAEVVLPSERQHRMISFVVKTNLKVTLAKFAKEDEQVKLNAQKTAADTTYAATKAFVQLQFHNRKQSGS